MGQLLGEEADGLWEDCPLEYALMYLCCQCCWFRFESLVVSGWIWSVSFSFFFNMKCRCYTAADKWVSYLEEYVAGLQKSFFSAQLILTTFLILFIFFFAVFDTVHTLTRTHFLRLSEADNQSGSPLGFLQTFDRFYTARILRQVCGCVNLSLLMTFSVFALLEAFMLSLSDGYCRQSEVYLIRVCRNKISWDSQVLSCSWWFSFRPWFTESVLNVWFEAKGM